LEAERYVEAGQMAMRAANGDFLEAVPFFVRERDAVVAVVNDAELVEIFAEGWREFLGGIPEGGCGSGPQ